MTRYGGLVPRFSGKPSLFILLKILQESEADAIFEEIRLLDFDSYYKDKKIPEVEAITKYCEFKSRKQVPVD